MNKAANDDFFVAMSALELARCRYHKHNIIEDITLTDSDCDAIIAHVKQVERANRQRAVLDAIEETIMRAEESINEIKRPNHLQKVKAFADFTHLQGQLRLAEICRDEAEAKASAAEARVKELTEELARITHNKNRVAKAVKVVKVVKVVKAKVTKVSNVAKVASSPKFSASYSRYLEGVKRNAIRLYGPDYTEFDLRHLLTNQSQLNASLNDVEAIRLRRVEIAALAAVANA